jgi:hypothetical protein
MTRSLFIRACGAVAAITAVTCCAFNARADIVTQNELPDVVFVSGTSTGSQAFADIGAPTVDSGNINTGTSFTIGNLISTGANAGYFTGLTTQIFGPVAFSPAVGSSLSFGNATFGSFLSTSITEQSNVAGERSFYVLGNYTAGTFDPALAPNPAPASMIVSFTQSPAGTGSISDSASLSIPPEAVPEPSTILLAGVGLAGGLVVDQSRRHRRRKFAGQAGGLDNDSSTIPG